MDLARAIDGIPVVRDAAQRGALFPTPAVDQRVWNKTTKTIERYDGLGWQNDLTGFTAAALGWFAFGDSTYGAKGDGVADDTVPIQTAANDAHVAGGGVVYGGVGTFKITVAILIYNNTVFNLSPRATLLRGAAIDNMIRNGADGVTGGYLANKNMVVMGGGQLDCNRTGFAVNTTPITFGHSTNVTVRDLTIAHWYGWHAIEFNASRDCRALHMTFTDQADSGNLGETIQLDLAVNAGAFPWFGPYDNTPCDNVLVEGCTFGPTLLRGVGSHSSVAGVRHINIRIKGNHFYGLLRDAIAALNWDDVVVSNNTMDGCGTGIYWQTDGTSCPAWLISKNVIRRSLTHGINIFDQCSDGRIQGNTVIESSQTTDLASDNIFLGTTCTNITVAGNTVRKGLLGKRPRYGINNSAASNTGIRITDNDLLTAGQTGVLNNAGVSAYIARNPGYNPVGPAAIAVTASPFTYTAGASPETVHIRAGTVSLVVKGGITLHDASPAAVNLEPNEAVTVTYTVLPTMNKDVH